MRTIRDPENRAAHKAYRPWWHSIGSFMDNISMVQFGATKCLWLWGSKVSLHVYDCSSGSQTKFDTRENLMESVFFFFLQFPRKPGKWHNGSYRTTTGDYMIVIICCLYPDGHRIFDCTAETTFVFVVLSLRLLGLVVSESRVPSISFLGGIRYKMGSPSQCPR